MTFYEVLAGIIASGTPCVTVTVVDTSGSVPNERGAKLIATAEGLHHGTVGGGKLERKALDEAASMLAAGVRTKFVNWSLNGDVGMTCGGSVKLYFESFNSASWQIAIFGAGHIAQALVPLLVTLDCRVRCVDSREEWLSRLPRSPRLTVVQTDELVKAVPGISDDAFIVLMSMGHTTDKPVLLELLRSGRPFPFIGVIGSEAKAIRLRKDIHEAGLPPEDERRFHCPVGLPIGSNDPAEIAVSVAAQLIQERDARAERSVRRR